MASSHSVNLIIYCLSNPGFRKRIYRRYRGRPQTNSRNSESNTTPSGFRMSQLTQRIRNTISKDINSSNVENSPPFYPSESTERFRARSMSDWLKRPPARNAQSRKSVNATLKNNGLNSILKPDQENHIELKRVVSV